MALHSEAISTANVEGDFFRYEYSTDSGATWTVVPLRAPTGPEDNHDDFVPLPSTLSGIVIVRIVDTDHTAGAVALDALAIDELFIRSVI